MAWIWPIIFAKKGFALSVSVIVFKFAILAWIMNEVATGGLIHQGWFSIGLAQVVLTSVLTALKLSRTEA
jgi:hypothetical protein